MNTQPTPQSWNYREMIHDALANKKAIGHFNISNLEGLRGVLKAAIKLNVPVIIGASEGERDFIGIPAVVALVAAYRREYNHPIFLNADHTYSFERVKQAIDAGFDSVIIDAAKLSIEENIALTKKCVEYARSITANTGRDIIVEGELGYIGQSSKILDAIPEGVGTDPASLTSPADALHLIQETGIDMIAPSVGNVHGLMRAGQNPALNIQRIGEISKAIGKPMVLHGASGISNTDLKAAVENGMAVVHYSTELRVAFRNAVRDFLAANPDEVAPYKIMASCVDAIAAVAEEKLRVMNGL